MRNLEERAIACGMNVAEIIEAQDNGTLEKKSFTERI